MSNQTFIRNHFVVFLSLMLELFSIWKNLRPISDVLFWYESSYGCCFFCRQYGCCCWCFFHQNYFSYWSLLRVVPRQLCYWCCCCNPSEPWQYLYPHFIMPQSAHVELKEKCVLENLPWNTALFYRCWFIWKGLPPLSLQNSLSPAMKCSFILQVLVHLKGLPHLSLRVHWDQIAHDLRYIVCGSLSIIWLNT